MRSRFIKKITGSVLASAMCLTLVGGQVMPVFATEETGTEMVSPAADIAGNSLTVNNPVAGHEYRAYQIFTGDVSMDGNTLSNIRYGSCFANAGEAVTQEDLDKITDAKIFVKELLADSAGNYTSGGVFSHGESDSSAVLTSENPTADLPAGYYLIIDTIKDADGQGHGDAVSDFVVEIVGNKTFSPKATSVPTFDKIINDGEVPEIPLDNGGTYDTGTEIDVKPGEILKIDGKPVETPYVFEEEGEHEVIVVNPVGNITKVKVNIVKAHTHNYTVSVTDATCTTAGKKTYSCDCGDTYDEEIAALGHMWGSVTNKARVKYTAVDPNLLTPGGYRPGTEFQVNSQDVFGFGAGASCENNFTVKLPYDGTLNVYVYSYNTNQFKDGSKLIIDDQLMTGHVKTYTLKANVARTINFRITKTNNSAGVSWAFDGGTVQACTRCGISKSAVSAMAMPNDNMDGFVNSILPTSLAVEDEGSEFPLQEAYDEIQSADASALNTDTTVRYGIGDSIPFRLSAVMPDSISAYETYKLVFHDSMTDGLTYDEGSLKVFAGDTEIPAENYTVASDDGMKTFTVTINDAKAEPFNALAGTEISVKYSATLNDAAVFRNINNAWLEYSNNPNGDGTGTTVSDDVTAFTFELGFDKVDKNGDTLAGAGFTLYKKTEDSYVQFGDEVTGGTSFSFGGLAVGDYKLVESTTPDGYNTMEDLEFSVVADSMEDADGNAYVTGLKIVAQGGTLESDILEGWTADTDTGILSADIANYKGSELPSTGGMGTMMFYVAGGCIMAVVCFILVKRKEQCAE